MKSPFLVRKGRQIGLLLISFYVNLVLNFLENAVGICDIHL